MLFAVGMLSLSLGACKKNDPVTPTPDPKPQPAPKPAPTPEQPKPQPAPEAHFNQSEVSVRIGKSVSATLENFTGTLTQEGKVDGFTVKIEKNVVTITADSYKPGKYDFTFKGGDKSYKLTVNLEKLPEVTESYAVYDLDTKKPVFEVNYHVNNSNATKTSITVAHKGDTGLPSFLQFDITTLTDKSVDFSILCNGIKSASGVQPYLSDGWHNGLKGIVIKKPNENSKLLSFVATVADKQIYVVLDTTKK